MSNVSCWWCCHPFPGPALHYPYRYDGRTKRFTTTGYFCSWECIKAYANDHGGSRTGEIQMYISLMKKHSVGRYTPIRCAPKRIALKMFGGTLSIEEFRKNSSNVVVTMPWETHIIPQIIQVKSQVMSAPPPSNDLVLKRTKPLVRAKSTLETSLGITRKTR